MSSSLQLSETTGKWCEPHKLWESLQSHLLTCVTRSNHLPNQPGLLLLLDVLENVLGQLLLHHQDSPNPTGEGLSHLLCREVPLPVEPAKDFRDLPAESIWKKIEICVWAAQMFVIIYYFLSAMTVTCHKSW